MLIRTVRVEAYGEQIKNKRERKIKRKPKPRRRVDVFFYFFKEDRRCGRNYDYKKETNQKKKKR